MPDDNPGMTTVEEVLQKTKDAVDIGQVFGEPVERGGVTIIPVASVIGGGGGGGGDLDDAAETGGGYGFHAQPVGVYVIKDGHVRFEPVVNVNKIVTGSLVVGIIAVVWSPRILKQFRKLVK